MLILFILGYSTERSNTQSQSRSQTHCAGLINSKITWIIRLRSTSALCVLAQRSLLGRCGGKVESRKRGVGRHLCLVPTALGNSSTSRYHSYDIQCDLRHQVLAGVC